MTKAITFDLWDTIIDDDSDEPKRAARGLRSKREERRHQIWSALNRAEAIDHERVVLAYDVAEAAFNHVWHDQHVTWTVSERLNVLLAGIGRTLPKGELRDLVSAHEQMELEIPPDPIPGIKDAVATLAEHYKLAVVSDAIVSPGRCLRSWLEKHELAQHFSGFAFSDEVGRSKPDRRMFDSAASQLGCSLDGMIHIGDRDHTDVKGAQAAGMKAILFVAKRDRDRDITSADAICDSADQLVDAVERLFALT